MEWLAALALLFGCMVMFGMVALFAAAVEFFLNR